MPVLDSLTRQIIGLCYRVSNILGHGFMEKVYENALALDYLRATGQEICRLINVVKAKFEVRWLNMRSGKGAGEFGLDVKDVPSETLRQAQRPIAGDGGDCWG